MIRINLLPDEYKKRKRHPAGLIAVSFLLAALTLFAVLASWWYGSTVIPSLEKRYSVVAEEKKHLLEKVAELQHMQKQSIALEGYIKAVESFYGKRVLWSRFLQDLQNVLREDAKNHESGRGNIRLIRIAGYGKALRLEGEIEAVSPDKADAALQDMMVTLMESTINADGLEVPGGVAATPLKGLLAEEGFRLIRIEPVEQEGAPGLGRMQRFRFYSEASVL